MRLQVHNHPNAMLDDSVTPMSASARSASHKSSLGTKQHAKHASGGSEGLGASDQLTMSIPGCDDYSEARGGVVSLNTSTVLRRITETSTAITSVKADMSRDFVRLMHQSTSVLKEIEVLRWVVIALLAVIIVLMVLVGVMLGIVT
jgi:hypothetical protein